ncbi:SRPBCC domain-containing protein [Streptomyces sp. ICN988]|uniref:SRPBCC family protein n=1 Tax=Streptomyces sp. ICN988 TaxID=2983765 RepID=UPI0021E4DFEE|nr:SRPBCC domain-containing protein [Streptomyces sp. ICN988]MCV2463606.1 SRPBCC domain-containing protein [Streptomyces sp. ICN988]
MSTDRTPIAADNGFSYTLTRTLDAPASRVWQAWTTPDQYAQWAYAVPGSVEMDVRPGGAWKATMRTPEGAEFPLTGSYTEVTEPRHLTIGMDVPGRPDPTTMTLDLTEQGPRNTVITLRQTCATAEERDGAEQGSGMLLDGLTGFLAAGPRG